LDVFVRLAGGALTGALQTPIHMRVAEIRQAAWEEFALEVENPAHLLVLELGSVPGRAIFHLPLAFAMSMLEVRMSGTGAGRFPNRQLTEIEDALLSPLIEAIFGELMVAFAPYIELHPRVVQKAPDIDLLQAVIPSGSCVIIDFAVNVGDVTFRPSLVTQFPTIRPIIEAIEHSDLALGAAERDLGPSPARIERVLEVPVDLEVVFPRTVHLSPVEVASLSPGDVIPLGHEPGRPLRVLAGGLPVHWALPTTIGHRLAAVIVDPDTYDSQEATS
jgi:flagellar motor switch protein FliM